MDNEQWIEVAQAIEEKTETEFAIANSRSVSGGCINQGYQISSSDTAYFVKLNDAAQVEMFAAEALGLKQMYATQTITVPQSICWGVAGNSSYIVLQWLDLSGGNNNSWLEMGRQLAAMHRGGTGNSFGWDRNNTIGSTPQINTWMDSWADFFAEQRIGYQLRLAKRRGGSFPDTNKVMHGVRDKLADRQPAPSLVHGDLWSGNAAIATDGAPVIFDPATYYGDRETDLAMTELFGGFPAAFYNGYNEVWQLDSGYPQRKSIYNLYHVLNHFNLFGGGYGNQAQRIIQQII
jgi:fructosamine-3-kinase